MNTGDYSEMPELENNTQHQELTSPQRRNRLFHERELSSDSDSYSDYESDEDDADLEAYYDQDQLDPNIIIDELLKGDKYDVERGNYLREKNRMISENISTVEGRGDERLTWRVRDDVPKHDKDTDVQFNMKTGIYGFDFNNKTVCSDGKNERVDFCDLFKLLWPGDIFTQLTKINTMIRDSMADFAYRKKRIVKPISPNEFLKFCAILMMARYEGVPGGNMWKNAGRSEGYRDIPNIANEFLPKYRFEEIKYYCKYLWADMDSKDQDEWWMLGTLCKEFSESRKKIVRSSNIKVMDESMSAFRPQSSPTGNLPHLSHIQRKPENLGTELKTVACPHLRIMLAIEICRSKNDPNGREFVRQYKGKKTTACCIRLLKASDQRKTVIDEAESTGSHLSNRERQKHWDKAFFNRQASRDIYIGDSWFGSVASALAFHENSTLAILQVKTATSRFPKKFIESRMKNWPAGSHLVLETTVSDTKLYAVGYKYCKRKTLCFIFNHGASSTEQGNPYIAKYRDQYKNARTRIIQRPECCSTYFQHCNVIDVHNHLRQKNLRLEKHWVTRDGYFRIFTTILGICVVDCWHGYRHHLPLKHRHKHMELIPFVNMLIEDLLKNSEARVAVDDRDEAMVIGELEVPVPSTASIASSLSNSQNTNPSPFFDRTSSSSESPSFGCSSSSSINRDIKLQLELSRHQILTTGRKTWESRTKSKGRATVTEMAKRTARGYCNECAEQGFDGKPRKTTQYCAVCVPENGTGHFWICGRCQPLHCERIGRNMNS